MENRKTISAGLAFLDIRDIDLAMAGNWVVRALDALGICLRGSYESSKGSCRIETEHHHIQLSQAIDTPKKISGVIAESYLRIQISDISSPPRATPCQTRSDLIMAHLLRVLNRRLAADYVKWIGPQTLIRHSDFARATAQLDQATLRPRAPRPQRAAASFARSSSVDKLPEIDEHSERLDKMLQREAPWAKAPSDQDNLRKAYHGIETTESEDLADSTPVQEIREETPVLRLSTWLISYAVALFCLPVGIALLIVNLLRGENLRLASQAAALTGTFISLQATGSMAQAASTLQVVMQ